MKSIHLNDFVGFMQHQAVMFQDLALRIKPVQSGFFHESSIRPISLTKVSEAVASSLQYWCEYVNKKSI